MTRRMIAALSLVAVAGGLAATAVPASATEGRYVCLTLRDKADPRFGDGICIEEILPGSS
jgi:hypothetical protein